MATPYEEILAADGAKLKKLDLKRHLVDLGVDLPPVDKPK
ncbi:hypothetical protein KIPB_014273, partial [Kipferlia bialata]|eukprot:g14273.t1